jgi:hypothetical protein
MKQSLTLIKKAVRILLILSYSAMSFAIFAQETEQSHLNQSSLKFKDGIYANVEMVKKNCPVPSTRIETQLEITDRDFYKEVTRSDQIIFYDENGVRISLDTKRIWGYSYNGDLHINLGGYFHKINFAGRISHFIASRTTYVPVSFPEGSISPDVYFPPVLLTTRKREYLIDIMNNKVWEFDLKGLEKVLRNDPQLLEEFMALKKRKKEPMKYNFLLRYNEKYPLEIPFD